MMTLPPAYYDLASRCGYSRREADDIYATKGESADDYLQQHCRVEQAISGGVKGIAALAGLGLIFFVVTRFNRRR